VPHVTLPLPPTQQCRSFYPVPGMVAICSGLSNGVKLYEAGLGIDSEVISTQKAMHVACLQYLLDACAAWNAMPKHALCNGESVPADFGPVLEQPSTIKLVSGKTCSIVCHLMRLGYTWPIPSFTATSQLE
jgi:hypothetical protein